MRRDKEWMDQCDKARMDKEGGNGGFGFDRRRKGKEKEKDFIEKQNLSCSLEKWNHW